MGLAAIIIHYIMNKSSMESSAGSLFIFSFVVSIFGCLLQIDYFSYGKEYQIGFLISFISTEMQEVAVTTLTANVAPIHLYKKLINPSFALACIGTLGRTIGCLQMVCAWMWTGNDQNYAELIQRIFTPLIFAFGFLLVISAVQY